MAATKKGKSSKTAGHKRALSAFSSSSSSSSDEREAMLGSASSEAEIGASRPRAVDADSGNEGGLGDAMAKILKTTLPPSTGRQAPLPVLAKRKAIERALEEERLEVRARALVRQERLLKRDSAHKVPDMESANYEKGLRKLATRGVVQLFNAVHQHQAAKERLIQETKEAKARTRPGGDQAPAAAIPKDAKSISKASFLQLLKMGGSARVSKTAPSS